MFLKNHFLFSSILLITLLNLFVIITATAQPNSKLWDKRFGGTDAERLTCFKQTNDGGYILGGNTISNIGGDKTQNTYGGSDYYIVKIDWLGNLQWEKDYGGIGDELLNSIQLTADGGYIIGGYSYSDSSGIKSQNTNGLEDYWIVKIDSVGNLQWEKTYGGADVDWCYAAQQTSDGGYIIGGYSYSNISGDKTEANIGSKDYWIIKTDSIGNKLWDKTFGGTLDDWFYSMQQTTDGGYILGGFSNSDSSGDKTENTWGGYDYWILKTDAAGNKQWDKDFGGSNVDGLFSMQQTFDGGYILGGVSLSGVSGNKSQPSWGAYDFWVIKTDTVGTLLWEKDYGGTLNEEVFGSIVQTQDSGYLMAGLSYSNISGDKTENNLGLEQTWIIKIDSSGLKQWDKTMFTNAEDEGGFALQNKDGLFIVANFSNAPVSGYKSQPAWNNSTDYWILKLGDSLLNVVANISCSDTSFCGNQCINFTNLSTNNPTITQWFFTGADSTSSNLQNPTNICYNNPGSFDVTLIACNMNGCDTIVLTNFINSYSPPTATIWGSNDTLYSSPAATYQWYEIAAGLISGATLTYYVPLQTGTYFCVINDSNGCMAISNNFVITAIQQNIIEDQFSIYPNPNNGNFLISTDFSSNDNGEHVLTIYNSVGQIVFSSNLKTNKTQLTTSLCNGVYFVEMNSGEKIYRQKMVVNN